MLLQSSYDDVRQQRGRSFWSTFVHGIMTAKPPRSVRAAFCPSCGSNITGISMPLSILRRWWRNFSTGKMSFNHFIDYNGPMPEGANRDRSARMAGIVPTVLHNFR
jgi:hypothetical protein